MKNNATTKLGQKNQPDVPTEVNFDNSATTFPKPLAVRTACVQALERYGGNPGRSGHSISLSTAEQVFSVREKVAELFGAEPENVVFTLNCTHAINMAMKGIMMTGGHMIISSLEHNSVARPCYALRRYGVSYSIAKVDEDDDITVESFRQMITPETKCICVTVASNVTGQILPFRKLAQLCREKDICFIADAAQAAGIIPITLADGFNFICAAGHKGLYGPAGTGLLISDGKYKLETLVEGGTGATSNELEQTDFLPERLESGTVNTVGIIGLGAGIDFVSRQGIMNIYKHEEELCRLFIKNIATFPKIIIYRRPKAVYAPIVSFNVDGSASAETATYLDENGFALRGGLQCAALTHRFLGTTNSGTVRFSPSVFNSEHEVQKLCEVLKKYVNY